MDRPGRVMASLRDAYEFATRRPALKRRATIMWSLRDRGRGGVDAVGFRLTAVDRLHGQGVAQDEGDVLVRAQVGEPVPGEHTLHADHQTVAERRDRFEEGLWVGDEVSLEPGLP